MSVTKIRCNGLKRNNKNTHNKATIAVRNKKTTQPKIAFGTLQCCLLNL